jgi:hypothetical protein
MSPYSLERLDLSGNLLSSAEDVANIATLPRLQAVWLEVGRCRLTLG